MNDEPCSVDINGQTYYGPCDLIDTIVFYTNKNVSASNLISTSSTNFYLVRNYSSQQDNAGGYPRINFYVNKWANYTRTSTSQPEVLNVTSYHVNHRNIGVNNLLLIVLIGVMFLKLLKR